MHYEYGIISNKNFMSSYDINFPIYYIVILVFKYSKLFRHHHMHIVTSTLKNKNK